MPRYRSLYARAERRPSSDSGRRTQLSHWRSRISTDAVAHWVPQGQRLVEGVEEPVLVSAARGRYDEAKGGYTLRHTSCASLYRFGAMTEPLSSLRHSLGFGQVVSQRRKDALM